MSASSEPVGTLATALAHLARLLDTRPDLAAEQALEILKVAPGEPRALLALARARRRLGDAHEPIRILDELLARHPGFAPGHCERGLALRGLGRDADAREALEQAVALEQTLAPAWLALGELHAEAGDTGQADRAFARYLECSTRNPALLSAGAALAANRLPDAETQLKGYLKGAPNDVAALRMLAEVAGRLRRYRESELLLRRCLELAPGFSAARFNLALVLHRESKATEALAEVDQLLAAEPRHAGYRNLKAAILGSIGEYDASIGLYEDVLRHNPGQAKIWMSYGHVLKTAGRDRDGIAAYRRSIELTLLLGEAYWSLANLKTFRFGDEDVEAMRRALTTGGDALDRHERLHFEFALGKALEDRGEWEDAFRHYAEANRLRRAEVRYDADENAARVRRARSLLTADFFARRAGLGCPAGDPIFIVGLPRSGSTLLEQILASHPLVEGTMELGDITAMARRLAWRPQDPRPGRYPDVLAEVPEERWRTLGEEYLRNTRVHRKLGRPHFIDKMPNNFAHVGLIHLALPNARIIDARRHPLACCFSNFKQHFAMGQNFTYDLTDVGRYYRDYVELMAHVDTVLPGRVHRVIYERLVEDTEAEVRRLLDYCGLEFDPACLRFYENSRAVRTASSEQVRRPIFRDGLDQWRHFEPWLEPLRRALGPVLDYYPKVPVFGH